MTMLALIVVVPLAGLAPAALHASEPARPDRREPKRRLLLGDPASDRIREIVRKWDEALVRGDVGLIGTLLDDEFTYVASDGGTFSKARLLESLKASGKLLSSSSRIKTLKIVGDTAIVLAEGSLSYARDGGVRKETYRYTDVFQRRKEDWKAIWTQVTVLPANP